MHDFGKRKQRTKGQSSNVWGAVCLGKSYGREFKENDDEEGTINRPDYWRKTGFIFWKVATSLNPWKLKRIPEKITGVRSKRAQTTRMYYYGALCQTETKN